MSEGIDAKSTTPADRGDVKSRLAGVRKRCDALRDRVPAPAAPQPALGEPRACNRRCPKGPFGSSSDSRRRSRTLARLQQELARSRATLHRQLEPLQLVDDAEHVLKLMKKSPKYRAISLSKATVFRLAIDRGLEALKQELARER